MAFDKLKKVRVIANLDHLVDVEVILGLSCDFPLLETMYNVINFSQLQDVCVCDFIVVIKIYKKDVYNLYFNPSTSFKSLMFHSFTRLVEWRLGKFVLKWITNLFTIIDHMVYKCFGQHIWTRHYDMITPAQVRVTRQVFSNVIFLVKQQCYIRVVAFCGWIGGHIPCPNGSGCLGNIVLCSRRG